MQEKHKICEFVPGNLSAATKNRIKDATNVTVLL